MEEEYTNYLVSVSKKLLLEYGQTADQNDVKRLRNLVLVKLHAQFLKDLREIQYCISLKICDLSGNFLTNIDELEYCINLIKLDLHNNQLEELPGPMFWANKTKLLLLYLHNNGLSALENVHSLSFCSSLIALTLFSTPLSLKVAYRHIVVNSIVSLKALDYYVISDEEIVEDWRLPEKYKPFNPCFFVDFCPVSIKETTFQKEMKMVREIISKINYVLSHHSPVLIIQKWIRGYLIRKILCLIPLHEALKHKRCIRDVSVHPSVKAKKHTEIKKDTFGIQVIDMKDLQEFRLYLRRLKHPVISSLLRLEEKELKQMKSKRSPRKDLLDWKKTEMKPDEMAAPFRLSVHKMPFYSLTDKLHQYKERSSDFFDAVRDLNYIIHPLPKIMPIHEPVGIEKRAFAKAYGAVRLRPLYAIDKAYWESEKWDDQLGKEREVTRMMIRKSEVQEYIKHLNEEKIEKIKKKYEVENLMTSDVLKEYNHKRSKLLSNMRQKYVHFLKIKGEKALESAFTQRFSTQHTSLTRGLLRLDAWRNQETGINDRKFWVKGIVDEQKQRKEVYKHYQEERQQMIQKQSSAEKRFRKCVAEEMAKIKFEQSKAKVEAMKKRRVIIPYSLPVIGSSAVAKPVVEYAALRQNAYRE